MMGSVDRKRSKPLLGISDGEGTVVFLSFLGSRESIKEIV